MDEQTRDALEKIRDMSRQGTDHRSMQIHQIARQALGEIMQPEEIERRVIDGVFYRMRHTDYSRDLQHIWTQMVHYARDCYREPEIYTDLKGLADLDMDRLAKEIVAKLPEVPAIAYHFQYGRKIGTLDELIEWMTKPGVYALIGFGSPMLYVPYFDGRPRSADIYKSAWKAAERRGLLVEDGKVGYYTKWIMKGEATNGQQ